MKKILLLLTLLFSLNVFSNELSNAPDKISQEEIISLQRKIGRKLDSRINAQEKRFQRKKLLNIKSF